MNILSSDVYSDISIAFSEFSSDDEVLDLVKELYDYLNSYIPVEITDSFIDNILEETGNSTGDAIMPAPPARQRRRLRQLILPKLLHRVCASQLLRLVIPRNMRRLVTRTSLYWLYFYRSGWNIEFVFILNGLLAGVSQTLRMMYV